MRFILKYLNQTRHHPNGAHFSLLIIKWKRLAQY